MPFKSYSLLFAFSIFYLSLTFCNAQNTTPDITLEQENALLEQASMQTDTISQQTPVAPFTITVKQIGEPSVKTFYKIPVEITITNNLDQTLCLMPPYFKDASFSTTDIQAACKDIATIEKSLASLIFIALAAGASIDLGLKLMAWLFPNTIEYNDNGLTKELHYHGMNNFFDINHAAKNTEAFKTVLKFCMKWGLILQPVIFTAKIINTARDRGEKMAYGIVPHGTRTIKGYLSKADMKLVQDGKLTSIFTTTNSLTNTAIN